MSSEANPFAGLFTNADPTISSVVNADVINSKDAESSIISMQQDNGDANAHKINLMVEKIFYITINDNVEMKSSENQLIYLEELAVSVAPQKLIDLDVLEQALFERLLLPNPSQYLTSKGCEEYKKDIIESDVLLYLYAVNQNLKSYISNDEFEKNAIKKMKELILRNAVTALKQPELFNEQILCDQIFYILKMHSPFCHTFLREVIDKFMLDDTSDAEQLKVIIKPVLKLILKDILKATLVSLDIYIFPALFLFTSNVHLANIFLDSCKPTNVSSGRDYQNCIIGSLLSLSVLPKTHTTKFEYFNTPLDKSANNVEEASLWMATDHLVTNLHKMFLGFLKLSPQTKNDLLEWVGNCLHVNSARGKIWSAQVSTPALLSCVSDGFMLNLCSVLLMLCQPFCSKLNNPKSLKIDPSYCAVEDNGRISKGIHMKELSKETCIIPPREVFEDVPGPTRPTVATYNFVTECFFMTHKTLDLGYRIIVEKLMKLSQELSQIRETFADVLHNSSGDLANILDRKMKDYMTRLVSMRCVLREPQVVALLSDFHAMTCSWLVQLAIKNNPTDSSNIVTFAPLTFQQLKFPLNDEEPDILRCVPEFIVENVCHFLSTSRHLKAVRDNQGLELLEPILSVVLVYMGDSKKMRNPHLRARLAECLFTLIPYNEQEGLPANLVETYIREKLFKEHPHRLQIVPSLLNVFVGIEVTGESVQFEQKFNYRKPMYAVMDYLWEIEEHRECFKRLSREAEENMEAVTPPIFLRFINLLINDAVFLLDEALNNMAQIRRMQAISDAELAQRSIEEREEHYTNLRFTGMIARFDNILGRHTISTLERLTSEIKSVFCHPAMVDRIAAMLNYFLKHLVGPNKKNFKVKDSKEYDFDPVATVLDICRIYIHLSENTEFCLAVSQDGRSYSKQLFQFAEDVLVRIHGGGELISSLRDVADHVSKLAQSKLEDEEVLADAPEEFLDPIMSTIMYDPVILPSSKITIDRATIARHLLSDQSDPFNRSPLTMHQVQPNEQLKIKVHKWVDDKRREFRENKNRLVNE